MSGPPYDLAVTRESARRVVDRDGWGALLARLDECTGGRRGQSRELYLVSREWYSDPLIRTVKARGARGDVLVKLID